MATTATPSSRGAPVLFHFASTHALAGTIGQPGGPSIIPYDGYILTWPTQKPGDTDEPGADLGSLLSFLNKIVRHAYSSVLLLDAAKHKAIICEPMFPFSDPVKRIIRSVFTGYATNPSLATHPRESGRRSSAHSSSRPSTSGSHTRPTPIKGFLTAPGIAFAPTSLCVTLSARSDVALIVDVGPVEVTIVPIYDARIMSSHTRFRRSGELEDLFWESPDAHNDDDEIPLHLIIYRLVESLDIDLQRPLYENLIFSGMKINGLEAETVKKLGALGVASPRVIEAMDVWTATSVFYQSSGNPERLRRVKLIGE